MPIVPPQGGQKQYVEKAGHVYGEQYHVGGPWPVGAIASIGTLYPPEGGPYLSTQTGVFAIHDTDWVVTSRRTGVGVAVLTDDEFNERYG